MNDPRLVAEPTTIYKFDGRTFTTLSDLRTHVENQLGALIDQLNRPFGPGDRIAIADFLIANRREVTRLLSVQVREEEGSPILVSIFKGCAQ